MARVVNPYDLDDDDDAIFAGALHDGRIWIEDDEDEDGYDPNTYYTITDDVLEEARDFLSEHTEEWVDFGRLCQHLHDTFGKLDPKRLGEPAKRGNSMRQFFAEYPEDVDLRRDEVKKGVHFIRVKRAT